MPYADPEKQKKWAAEFHKRNRDRRLQRNRERYIKFREIILKKCKEHYESNKEVYFEKSARRRDLKNYKNISKEDRDQIRDLYKQSRKLKEVTGIQFHIDHIIPLARGGTHTVTNMQILTAQDNLSKGSRIV